MKSDTGNQKKRNRITEDVKSLFRRVCKYQGKYDPMRFDEVLEDLLYDLKNYLDKEFS